MYLPDTTHAALSQGFEMESRTRIGVMSFEWGTNYGAVLQSYALQQAFGKLGYRAEAINFVPWRMRVHEVVKWVLRGQINELKKEFSIGQFRKHQIQRAKRRYVTSRGLARKRPDHDIFVTGSDQVWNETVLMKAERQPCLAYFLDFVPPGKPKISYAASFGSDTLTPNAAKLVLPSLSGFTRIGVRERSGVSIIENLNLSAELVPDPTLLLSPDDYAPILSESPRPGGIFRFIMNDPTDRVKEFVDAVTGPSGFHSCYSGEGVHVGEWLGRLRSSDLVATSSFHAVVFALLFRRQILAVRLPGSKMNGRIESLLQMVGLERLYFSPDANPQEAARQISRPIDWDAVEHRIHSLRGDGYRFLRESLADAKSIAKRN